MAKPPEIQNKSRYCIFKKILFQLRSVVLPDVDDGGGFPSTNIL